VGGSLTPSKSRKEILKVKGRSKHTKSDGIQSKKPAKTQREVAQSPNGKPLGENRPGMKEFEGHCDWQQGKGVAKGI